MRARAPTAGSDDPDATIGGITGLVLWWRFRKESPDASLRFVLTETFLEIVDDNSAPVTKVICPWGGDVPDEMLPEVCREVLNATIEAEYHVNVIDDFDGDPTWKPLFRTSGRAILSGFANNLEPIAFVGPGFGGDNRFLSRLLFETSQFDFLRMNDEPRDVQLRLKSPITIEVPIDTVPVGTVLEVYVRSEARVWSRRRNESFVSAYFRDPAGSGGGPAAEFAGLTMLEAPSEAPPIVPIPPAPACAAPGSGGAIQFETTDYFKPEWPGDEGHVAKITVTRTGGEGEASALFTTGGGTAIPGTRDTPGSDYEPVSTHVWFASGETGTRAVYVPIIGDLETEGDETVTVTLSDPSGCTALGGVTSATLTIRDDDEGGLQENAYTIGGTVTGLEGSGLVLTNNSTDHLEITEDGPFAFDREYATGVIYNVQVDTQPNDPAQFCTVTNGNGTVAGEDVTDIEVMCETIPAGAENLDAAFGTGGKVTSDEVGPVADVALQDDGKIVVVGGNASTGAKLARYTADGGLDTSFGTGGVVAVEFYGSAHDVLNAVALQSDGRIVVAGYSKDGVNSAVQEDFIVARYDPDGTLDTSFGAGGKVITDFDAHGDGAYDVLIQPDGAIVVVGSASLFDTGLADSDFAAVRYTSAGQLDTAFGTGGKVTTNIAGRTDLGYAAALQPDGKIVLAGRVADSGGSDPDIGLVRYDVNGTLDASFGENGVAQDQTGHWDEAADVIVQPDGKILIVGHTTSGTTTLTLARYHPDGTSDGGFGAGGRVGEIPGIGRGVGLQPDGKLVAVGWIGPSDFSVPANFVVARFDAGGELDTTFGGDGAVEVDFFGASDVANAIVIQADGKIVVAGSAANGTATGLGLIRILP